jgi:hypothetical protein
LDTFDRIVCSEKECQESIPNNKWAKIRAGSPKKGEGWFFSMEDPKIAHCPNHLPDWVPAWREKKRLERHNKVVMVEFETAAQATYFYEFVQNSRLQPMMYKSMRIVEEVEKSDG